MPCPPAAWSTRLASKRAWYSGVNGGCCAGPQALVGSKTLARPWPTPTVFAFGPRRHWPFKSGYFVSSNAHAPTTVDSSAASSMDTTVAPRSGIAASSQTIPAGATDWDKVPAIGAGRYRQDRPFARRSQRTTKHRKYDLPAPRKKLYDVHHSAAHRGSPPTPRQVISCGGPDEHPLARHAYA